MWKSIRSDETPVRPVAPSVPVQPARPATAASTAPAVAPATYSRLEVPRMDTVRAEIAHIGKSVVIRGELSGSEDLYLDGEVEGSIDLRSNSLTIGPNGRIRANVQAREVVVHGRVDGNLRAFDRVELKKTAVLAGDVSTQRIMIEDGAFFKGAIDIQKGELKNEPKRDNAMAAAAGPVA